MNERELYKRSFQKLQPTEHFQKELFQMMEQNKRRRVWRPRQIMALAAVVVVAVSLMAAASAAGVFQNVRVWINGREADPEQVQSYMNEDGSMTIEVEETEGGRVDVIYSDEPAELAEDPAQSQILAEFQEKEGRKFLLFTNENTGETVTMDITGELMEGEYHDTVTVFGRSGIVDVVCTEDHVSLTVEME